MLQYTKNLVIQSMHKCYIGRQNFIVARKFNKLLYNKLYFTSILYYTIKVKIIMFLINKFI
jgi:hypothetical protein